MQPIVIAAGGTGGHFFPAEALATALIARGHRIVLMTDERTASRLGPVFSRGETHVLSGAGLAGRGFAKAARATASLTAGILQARAILARIDAGCIVGFGGYPSVPPVVAARLLRRRPMILLHEQNAVLGRANRVCARMADLLALGMADTAGVPLGTSVIFTGNPVRPAIQAVAETPYVPPHDRIELLVLGGSLGARIFADVVPDAVARLTDTMRKRLHVTQQCRQEDLHRVRTIYGIAGVEADLAPFFDDVADRLAAAHLVISRAGASSCAELAVTGRPALLVPLPGAIEDHQMANACALTGAIVLPQTGLTSASLAARLESLLGSPSALVKAARQITRSAFPFAGESLAVAVESLLSRVDAPP